MWGGRGQGREARAESGDASGRKHLMAGADGAVTVTVTVMVGERMEHEASL